MILFEVCSSQPNALFTGEHGQSMRIDSPCTFKCIIGDTLRKNKKKDSLSKLANDREKVHRQIGEKYQLQLPNRFALLREFIVVSVGWSDL